MRSPLDEQDVADAEERAIDRHMKLVHDFDKLNIRAIANIVNQTAIDHGFAATAHDVDRALLLIVGEIVEAQNEIRAGHGVTEIYESAPGKLEGVPIELADAVIRILNFAAGHGIDIQAAIELKATYNESRPYKHGKAF